MLLAGRALCGRQGTPDTWDADERWVGIENAAETTCPGCKRKWEILKKLPRWRGLK